MTIAVADWIVIGAYLASMVGFGLWLARKTNSSEDCFLGGRSIPPMIAAMSIMATQTSTNSLVSRSDRYLTLILATLTIVALSWGLGVLVTEV